MQEVLREARERDPAAAALFELINKFDLVSATATSPDELADLAARESDSWVLLRDHWNDLSVDVAANGHAAKTAASASDLIADVAGRMVVDGIRGRTAACIELDGLSALVASIEVASGRVGFAALVDAPDRTWRALDHLIVERLAASVATFVVDLRRQRIASTFDPAALERLLAGGLDEDQLSLATRQARLRPEGEYSVIALGQSPRNALSLEGLGSLVERALERAEITARTAVMGRSATVVVPADEDFVSVLQGLVAQPDRGFDLFAGVGDARPPAELAMSWQHAREALTLRGVLDGDDAIASFSDLGVLHLLAQIPRDEILESELFTRLSSAVVAGQNPSDLDVLQAYLTAGSLRGAAAKVYLHHTSVEHRLKRIQAKLGVDLSSPNARFSLQLLVNLYAILRSEDAAQV